MKPLTVQPIITEKSLALAANGIYQFAVPSHASKAGIVAYIARQFNVHVERVTTANRPKRRVLFRRHPGLQSGYKKATVRLKEGDTINEFSLPAEETPPTGKNQESAATAARVPSESTITVRSKSKKTGK